MKNKRNLLFLLGGIILGVTIMGIVICFTIGKINLVDKVYTAKVNSTKEEKQEEVVTEEIAQKQEVPVYEVTEKIEKVKEVVKEQIVVVREKTEKAKSVPFDCGRRMYDARKRQDGNIEKEIPVH